MDSTRDEQAILAAHQSTGGLIGPVTFRKLVTNLEWTAREYDRALSTVERRWLEVSLSSAKGSRTRDVEAPFDLNGDPWLARPEDLRETRLIECVTCGGEKRIECTDCGGSGRTRCGRCSGRGLVPSSRGSGSKNCPGCRGRGDIGCEARCTRGTIRCTGCDGLGRAYGQVVVRSHTEQHVVVSGDPTGHASIRHAHDFFAAPDTWPAELVAQESSRQARPELSPPLQRHARVIACTQQRFRIPMCKVSYALPFGQGFVELVGRDLRVARALHTPLQLRLAFTMVAAFAVFVLALLANAVFRNGSPWHDQFGGFRVGAWGLLAVLPSAWTAWEICVPKEVRWKPAFTAARASVALCGVAAITTWLASTPTLAGAQGALSAGRLDEAMAMAESIDDVGREDILRRVAERDFELRRYDNALQAARDIDDQGLFVRFARSALHAGDLSVARTFAFEVADHGRTSSDVALAMMAAEATYDARRRLAPIHAPEAVQQARLRELIEETVAAAIATYRSRHDIEALRAIGADELLSDTSRSAATEAADAVEAQSIASGFGAAFANGYLDETSLARLETLDPELARASRQEAAAIIDRGWAAVRRERDNSAKRQALERLLVQATLAADSGIRPNVRERDLRRSLDTATRDAARDQQRAQSLNTREQQRVQSMAASETSRRAATEQRWDSAPLLCNDGTRSPSCRCGRDSYRGCCSHHGGVAGCSAD